MDQNIKAKLTGTEKGGIKKEMSPEKKSLIDKAFEALREENPKSARQYLLEVCVNQIDQPEIGVDNELVKLEIGCTALECLLSGSEDDKKTIFAEAEKARKRLDKAKAESH